MMIKDCLKRRISNDLRKNFGKTDNYKEINIEEYINKYIKEFPYLSNYMINSCFMKVLDEEYDLKSLLCCKDDENGWQPISYAIKEVVFKDFLDDYKIEKFFYTVTDHFDGRGPLNPELMVILEEEFERYLFNDKKGKFEYVDFIKPELKDKRIVN